MSDWSAAAAFSETAVSVILERELSLALSCSHRQEHPLAILLAGQPGAGKTELSTMLLSQMHGDPPRLRLSASPPPFLRRCHAGEP